MNEVGDKESTVKVFAENFATLETSTIRVDNLNKLHGSKSD